MLRAADELHADACITYGTWALLAAHLNERQLIEVPVLAGQYHLVSHMLNSLGIEREPALHERARANPDQVGPPAVTTGSAT